MKRPKLEGGLQISDPSLANIALGGKILWQLYSNKHHPVNQLLQNKYFKGASLRSLQVDRVTKGTPLWDLCRKGLATFQNQLYRVPGNGANIMIWQDKIMGNSPPWTHNGVIWPPWLDLLAWLAQSSWHLCLGHPGELGRLGLLQPASTFNPPKAPSLG